MANNGGKRPGSGRKKGSVASHTLEAATAKALLITMFCARQVKINNALLKKAETGDVPAIKECFDRVYGKAVQETILMGKDGKDLIPDTLTKSKVDESIRKYIDARNSKQE